MEERLGGNNHRLIVSNRNTIQMTGVVDVISFDTNDIDGHADSLIYSNSQKFQKSSPKGFGRLFK